MECQPPPSNDHKYIIILVDYFTKWEDAMPTFNNLPKIATRFFLNNVITHFEILKQLVSDHITHFQDDLFQDLSHLLGFFHEFYMPYYPQANGQVEAINHVLKTML